jgi:large subunit ribosomal protein L28
MARICGICGKRPQVANLVSNAKNRVKRWVYPNVKTMRYTKPNDTKNSVTRGKVCAKCVKGGKVTKVM